MPAVRHPLRDYGRIDRFFVDVGGLLRLAAQKEQAKADNGLARITNCAVFAHIQNYSRQITFCKRILPAEIYASNAQVVLKA